MAYVENVDLIPLDSRNTSGNAQSASNFGGSTQAILQIRTTAVTGTLYVSLEDSIDGVNWFRVDGLSTGSLGNIALRVDRPFTDNLRVAWYFSGSNPTATFAVSLAAF